MIKLEDTIESLRAFKNEVQTNYNKFFKSTFKENNFQQNWEELEKIRHKIAHNNLFVLEDQEKTTELVTNLMNTIKLANEEVDKISFSEKDKEFIMSNFMDFKEVTKEILIEELQKSIEWANNSADGFVGLQSFLVNILGPKGYQFQHARDLINKLEKEGIVEIYKYSSPEHPRSVTSIKLKK